MKSSIKLLIMAFISLLAFACRSHEETVPAVAPLASQPQAHFMPKAVIYKMNGDWSQYVPVTLNAARTALQSYPAPSDIRPSGAPVALADGWWLDRRGISTNTAFTTYTYQQYAALPQAPSPAQLLHSLLPDARVTAVVELPMSTQQAASDIPAVNDLIHRGLPGCRTLNP